MRTLTVSAGVAEAQATARALDGFNVRFAPATGDKETRAKPVSAQAEAGNVKIVRGLWNDEFLRVLENFPAAKHDDEVDALSGAHEMLCNAGQKFEIETFRASENHFRGMDVLGGCKDRFRIKGALY